MAGKQVWGSPDWAWLRWAPWIVLVAALVVGLMSVDPDTGRDDPVVRTALMIVFFAILGLRLVAAMRASASQRPAVLAVLVGILLWGIGTVVLSAGQASAATPTAFPGPGEGFFLAACLSFAAFVFMDGQASTARWSAAAWTDAAILCGGAAALASAVLLTPVSRAYPDSGFGLLIALVYPLIDVVLILLVVGQWALGARAGGARTGALVLAFVAFAIADTSLLLGMPAGEYTFSAFADLMWGVAFALLADVACRPRPIQMTQVDRQVPPLLLLIGFVLALVLLAFHPPGAAGLAVAASACVVLVAAGVRLVMALRAAQTASDALRDAARDDLTALPNRRALVRRVNDGIAAGERLGLLLVDIDAFKDVNAALGHSAGDDVLRMTAERISELLPARALLARVGGDEFAIIVATDDQVVLFEIAAAVRRVVSVPMSIDGMDVSVRVSVGITWRLPADAAAVDMLRRADLAMYSSRQTGVGIDVYQDSAAEFSRRHLQMANDLRAAMPAGQLTVWYQPKVLAATGAVTSLEALVRWIHPREGMLHPAQFLPLARREGLMLELSRQVADLAIDDLVRWRGDGLDVSVSLNVAAPELTADLFVPFLLARLATAGLAPHHVILEVAEDSFLAAPERVTQALTEARQAGLRASLDEYGSGFSSLTYLRDLRAVSEIKLDRPFTTGICTDSRSAVIVSSTVAMAHALGMTVVAGGVETELLAARAIVLGVDALQGFYLSRPMPADGVAGFVRALEVGTTTG